MRPLLKTDLLRIARVFDKQKEVEGPGSNPVVLAMLRSAAQWVTDDDTAWCGAFMNAVVLIGRSGDARLKLPAFPLRARHWLTVGADISIDRAKPGFDFVVCRRNGGPGPEVLDAIGHVALFVRREGNNVVLYGGNQKNMVCEAAFPISDILGIRRL